MSNAPRSNGTKTNKAVRWSTEAVARLVRLIDRGKLGAAEPELLVAAVSGYVANYPGDVVYVWDVEKWFQRWKSLIAPETTRTHVRPPMTLAELEGETSIDGDVLPVPVPVGG